MIIEFLIDIMNAHQEVESLSSDASSLSAVTTSVEMALNDPRLRRVLQDDDPMIQALESLRHPLERCQELHQQLKEMIKKRTKSTEEGCKFRSTDFKWIFSTRRQVQILRAKLHQNTSTLNQGLGAVTSLTALRLISMGKADVSREIKRTSATTDASHTLRQYPAEFVKAEDPFDNTTSVSTRRPSTNAGTQAEHESLVTYYWELGRKRDELHTAARSGDLINLARLIAEGVDINAKGSQGNQAVYTALESGNEEAALLLISHGCDISAPFSAKTSALDRKFKDGRTPMIWAAAQGMTTVIGKLVALGADVNAKTPNGRYALQEAARAKRYDAAKMLLDSGASVHLTDEEGWTALHQCADQGAGAIMRLVLQHDPRLEAITSHKNVWNVAKFVRATPLLIAIEHETIECVRLLIEAGANLRAENSTYEQPIHIAARIGNLSILKLVLGAGVGSSEMSRTGDTPLGNALKHSQVEVAEFLKSL